jgi:hypothetical protein
LGDWRGQNIVDATSAVGEDYGEEPASDVGGAEGQGDRPRGFDLWIFNFFGDMGYIVVRTAAYNAIKAETNL